MMCIGDFFSVVGRPWPPTPQVPFVSSGGRKHLSTEASREGGSRSDYLKAIC